MLLASKKSDHTDSSTARNTGILSNSMHEKHKKTIESVIMFQRVYRLSLFSIYLCGMTTHHMWPVNIVVKCLKIHSKA